MHPRLLFSEEDEVRKKKTWVLVLAFLLIPVLLGLYAATGPEGGPIAGATPTALPSPSAVVTVTTLLPTLTATATPSASATRVAQATATPLSTPTPVPPQPKVTPTVVPVAIEPTPALTVVPIAPLVAPVITTPPGGSVLKDDRPTIAGAAPPNTTVQVYDDGTLVGAVAADARGDWILVADKPLEPGEHTVTAVASDEAGRTSAPSAAVTFTVVIERLPVTGSSGLGRWLDRLLPATFP